MLQPSSGDIADIRKRRLEPIRHELAEKGLRLGAPLFVRIFKQSHELEVWVQQGDRFRLYKTFPICKWSGSLGPKLREGDGQSPEGFYRVRTGQLNPDSSYHLSFNLGFPNTYDSAHGRTGSFLMVHGRCVSIGCYAMTDAGIEEIYLIAEAALAGGQDGFDVHVFPFRMTEEAWTTNASSRWVDFWRELQPAYDGFEATRRPPRITAANGVYQIDLQP